MRYTKEQEENAIRTLNGSSRAVYRIKKENGKYYLVKKAGFGQETIFGGERHAVLQAIKCIMAYLLSELEEITNKGVKHDNTV